jgi:hypothetical protein
MAVVKMQQRPTIIPSNPSRTQIRQVNNQDRASNLDRLSAKAGSLQTPVNPAAMDRNRDPNHSPNNPMARGNHLDKASSPVRAKASNPGKNRVSSLGKVKAKGPAVK